jgi:hypothetical protein
MGSAVVRFFSNAETGRLVVAQPPNGPLVVFLAATAIRILAHPEGTAGTVVSVVGSVALLVWAGLEIARGDSPFRRVLGTVVLVATLAGLLSR